MKQKVLIVEDNPQHMKITKMSLRSKGYMLLEATDGEEALDIARQKRPDLIIMDLRLPKMSGVEVARRLKMDSTLCHIPIIAVTAHVAKGDRKWIVNSWWDAYLPKPFSTRELPALIAQMLLNSRRVTSEDDGKEEKNSRNR